jgi:ABC-type multidrug transport system permease subunit
MSKKRVHNFWTAIRTIAYKEFIHIWRDRRVVLAILIFPPFFTYMFGKAFEDSGPSNVPVMLYNADNGPLSRRLVDLLHGKDVLSDLAQLNDVSELNNADPEKARQGIDDLLKDLRSTFAWKPWKGNPSKSVDLLRSHVTAAIIIPVGWQKAIEDGAPIPLQLVLDGSDTNTAPAIQNVVRAALQMFQLDQRMNIINNLPEGVIDLGEKLPLQTQHALSSSMTPWDAEAQNLYNPGLKYIDYMTPGIVGLILQLLTVTLIASTITGERETGTLSQLLVTPLRRSEIVIGKVLPHLIISLFLIAGTILFSNVIFQVPFRQPFVLSLVCFLFLLCSLGVGLLISAIAKTQTQAIQFSIFILLPVFILSGAFVPLSNLPDQIQLFSQVLPLTHFCHAFRLINMYSAQINFITSDLVFLAVGAILTCGAAAFVLRTTND